MTINEKDFVATISDECGKLHLTIIDSYEWKDDGREHLSLMLREIKGFIASMMSGKIHESYPAETRDKPVVEVTCKYLPSNKASILFNSIGKLSTIEFRLILPSSE